MSPPPYNDWRVDADEYEKWPLREGVEHVLAARVRAYRQEALPPPRGYVLEQPVNARERQHLRFGIPRNTRRRGLAYFDRLLGACGSAGIERHRLEAVL